MPKISQCDRCLLYAHNPHLVCPVHPSGVDTNSCIDFRLDPNIQEEEQWSYLSNYKLSQREVKIYKVCG